jgi:hypothetical protein
MRTLYGTLMAAANPGLLAGLNAAGAWITIRATLPPIIWNQGVWAKSPLLVQWVGLVIFFNKRVNVSGATDKQSSETK